MSCKHENQIATRRILANGVITVSMQCQECGSGFSREKSKFKVNELPPFDESIKEQYRNEQSEKYDRLRRQFEEEQASRTGEWWNRYNSYLNSTHWRNVRVLVLRRDLYCQVCFESKSTQAHHLTYHSFNRWGMSFPVECVGVCEKCHGNLHSDPISMMP